MSCHLLSIAEFRQKVATIALNFFRFDKATIIVEQSVEGMIKVIDVATRETHRGKPWVWDGKVRLSLYPKKIEISRVIMISLKLPL